MKKLLLLAVGSLSAFTGSSQIVIEAVDFPQAGDSIYQGIAAIPDYKTSVLLNKVFRNIKENDNLDALEESDNEDEFEKNLQ